MGERKAPEFVAAQLEDVGYETTYLTLAVARQFKREGTVPARDLIFAFVSDEEAGGVLGALPVPACGRDDLRRPAGRSDDGGWGSGTSASPHCSTGWTSGVPTEALEFGAAVLHRFLSDG